jgi:hypothetical protein
MERRWNSNLPNYSEWNNSKTSEEL